jgi:hypothetical protein|tara:strand:- start:275 stop:577 length:303 start_codon:yes stop_codon:yes gene_type:complete
MKKQIREQIKKLERLSVVLIEWVDAEKDPGDGWCNIDEALPSKNQYVTARTVGFYVGKSPSLLRTTSDYDPSNNKVYGYNDIQLSNIKSITVLKDAPTCN